MWQAHADAAYAEFSRTIGTYRFSAAGLTADARLLAHADRAVKPRRGRKPDKSGLDIPVYLEALRCGEGRWQAARAQGVEPKDVKQKLQFDSDFRDAVILAEEEAAEQVEEKLWMLATSGEKWAMQEWLQKRYKDRWGAEPTVVQHEGVIEHSLSATPLIEQVLALQEALKKRAELEAGPPMDIIDVDEIED